MNAKNENQKPEHISMGIAHLNHAHRTFFKRYYIKEIHITASKATHDVHIFHLKTLF